MLADLLTLVIDGWTGRIKARKKRTITYKSGWQEDWLGVSLKYEWIALCSQNCVMIILRLRLGEVS